MANLRLGEQPKPSLSLMDLPKEELREFASVIASQVMGILGNAVTDADQNVTEPIADRVIPTTDDEDVEPQVLRPDAASEVPDEKTVPVGARRKEEVAETLGVFSVHPGETVAISLDINDIKLPINAEQTDYTRGNIATIFPFFDIDEMPDEDGLEQYILESSIPQKIGTSAINRMRSLFDGGQIAYRGPIPAHATDIKAIMEASQYGGSFAGDNLNIIDGRRVLFPFASTLLARDPDTANGTFAEATTELDRIVFTGPDSLFTSGGREGVAETFLISQDSDEIAKAFLVSHHDKETDMVELRTSQTIESQDTLTHTERAFGIIAFVGSEVFLEVSPTMETAADEPGSIPALLVLSYGTPRLVPGGIPGLDYRGEDVELHDSRLIVRGAPETPNGRGRGAQAPDDLRVVDGDTREPSLLDRLRALASSGPVMEGVAASE